MGEKGKNMTQFYEPLKKHGYEFCKIWCQMKDVDFEICGINYGFLKKFKTLVKQYEPNESYSPNISRQSWKDYLRDCNLLQFGTKFIDLGYDDIRVWPLMVEEDFENIGLINGHLLKFQYMQDKVENYIKYDYPNKKRLQ